jgi:hypothetical protein
MIDPRIALAVRVREALAARGVETALIGGAALAAHQYTRATQDIDLGAGCDLQALRDAAVELRAAGLRVEVREPGPPGTDALDGTLNAFIDDECVVQVVNNKTRLGREAVATAIPMEGLPFRVVDLPHLIALKLKAGSFRDYADVQELLTRNPSADLDAIHALCVRFKVSKRFERVLAERAGPRDPEDN